MISSSLRRPVKMASNNRLVFSALSGWPSCARARAAGKSTEALVTFIERPSCRFFGEVACDGQEIVEQGMTVFAGDALGVKLHAMDGMAFVHHALDYAVFRCGGDVQGGGHGR